MIEELIIASVQNAVVATALAVVVAAVVRSNRRPKLSQMLWWLVLLKLVMPPIIEVPVMRMSDAHSDLPSTLAADFNPRSLAADPPQVSEYRGDMVNSEMGLRVVASIWITGTLILLLTTLSRCIAVAQLIRRSSPAPSSLQTAVTIMAGEMGIRTTVSVRVSTASIAPLVFDFGRRPTLVLPTNLLAVLTPEEQSAVVRHELVHVRRRDHLLIWFESIIVCLYWWHPVAWMARRRIRQAAEVSCDTEVLANGQHEPEAYARAFIKTLDSVSEGGRSAAVFASFLNGNVHHLKERLEMILQHTQPKPLGIRARLYITVVTLGALVLTPVLLSADEKDPVDVKKDSPPTLTLVSIDGTTMIAEGTIPKTDDREVRLLTAESPPGCFNNHKGVFYRVDETNGLFVPDDVDEYRKQRIRESEVRRASQEKKSIDLKTRIEKLKKEASAFKVAVACRKPVHQHSPNSRASDLTARLSREIIDRITVRNGKRHVA